MKQCCICGAEISGDSTASLFIGDDGNYRDLCAVCENKMNSVYAAETAEEKRKALVLMKSLAGKTTDMGTKSFLKGLIGTYEYEEETYSDASVSLNPIGADIWIKGLKFLAWIVFAAIIIAGTVLGIAFGSGLGVLIFFISVLLAFLSVAGIMVFLNMAENIMEIRNAIAGKKEK